MALNYLGIFDQFRNGLWGWTAWVRFLAKEIDFFLHYNVQTNFAAKPAAPYQFGSEGEVFR
jgi:hypothetical protein